MRVFVINLKKNVERLALITERLNALSVAFTRIDAILGRSLSDEERRSCSSSFWWWCINGCKQRAGQYGCAASHRLVYEMMVRESIPLACVLEDDAVPRPVLKELLKKIESWVDREKPQVVLIANHLDKDKGGGFRCKRIPRAAFAEGYVLTLHAAAKILEKNTPIKFSADEFGLMHDKGWVELFQAYPEGVNQEWEHAPSYTSDVTYRGRQGDVIVDCAKMNILELAIWKIKRVIGTLAVKLFLR